MPPAKVISPQTPPRSGGRPRPVRLPSSLRAPATPIEIPAPTLAAAPTRNASDELWVAKAAANSGASVETELSISPASRGWMIWRTNSRRPAAASSARALALGDVAVDARILFFERHRQSQNLALIELAERSDHGFALLKGHEGHGAGGASRTRSDPMHGTEAGILLSPFDPTQLAHRQTTPRC